MKLREILSFILTIVVLALVEFAPKSKLNK